MVLIGAVVTTFSIVAGAVYVQAAITNPDRNADLEASEAVEREASERADETPATSSASPPAERNLARANEPVPPADRGESFLVTCSPVSPVATGNNGPAATCRVNSFNGFNAAVDLSCANTPPGLSCQFNPARVAPPANGSVGLQLLIASDTVAPGSYVFEVVGRSGGSTHQYTFPFSVSRPPAPRPSFPLPGPINNPVPVPDPVLTDDPPPEPDFNIACTLPPGAQSTIDRLQWSLTDGSRGTIKCLMTPENGFDEEVNLSLANESDQIINSSFLPEVIQPDTGQSFDLNFELGQMEVGKEYTFDVTATSVSKTLVRRVVLTVIEGELQDL